MKKLSQRASQRMENFQKALHQLELAVSQKTYTELEIAGLTQTFEFTIELLWKLLKDLCEQEGLIIASPKDVIRQSAQLGIIDNPDQLIEALDQRNYLSHTYNESLAEQAFILIRGTFEPSIRSAYNSILKIYECSQQEYPNK